VLWRRAVLNPEDDAAFLSFGQVKRRKMSSFSNPHYMYLFEMTTGKKKLCYGKSPEDALEILSFRLSEAEMEEIVRDKFEKIHQRQLQDYIHLLG
jgi:hypothetical protein